MEDIKSEDLYLSKEELKDIVRLVAKKRNIKNLKVNRVIDCIKFFKNNLKIRKE